MDIALSMSKNPVVDAFNRLPLGRRIVVALLLVGLLPLTIGSGFAYKQAREGLLNTSGGDLESQAQSVGEKIDRNLFERYGDVQAFAFNPRARGTSQDVTDIANFYTKAYGFYDLMMVLDKNGNVVATNNVKPDGSPFDTSSLIGKSFKGQAWFDKAISGAVPAGQSEYEQPASDPTLTGILPNAGMSLRFTAPIRDEAGNVQRVWTNLASLDRVVGQMIEEQTKQAIADGEKSFGMAVLSPDGIVIQTTEDDTTLGSNMAEEWQGAKDAVAKKSGHLVEKGHVVGYHHANGALGFAGYDFSAVVVEHAVDAAKEATSLRDFMIALWLVSAAIIVGVAFLFGRSIVGPLAAAADSVERTSGEMTSTSQTLGASAEETATQASVVASASEQVSANVASVASAVEEMHASIGEIANATSNASGVAVTAVDTVRTTTDRISRLGESSSEIGKVVGVITAIAEQTNLLALNATIEAARAGEAGKGFAVVANEVKELAKETADATNEISNRVSAIQQDTTDAVSAIAEISEVISQINEIQTTIASAIEEQTVTTAEIARSIAEVSVGATGITHNITGVAEAAGDTSRGATDVERFADVMRHVAADLSKTVGNK